MMNQQTSVVCFVTFVSMLVGLSCVTAGPSHDQSKRANFFDIQCQGVYDKSIFAKLDRICEDCYNLFREPQVHILCSQNCFKSEFFKACLDVLLMEDEYPQVQSWIIKLHGGLPDKQR